MQALFSFFLQIFSLGTSVIFLMLLRLAAGYAIFKIQRGKPQAATPVIMLSYCTIAVTIRGSGGYFRLPLKIPLSFFSHFGHFFVLPLIFQNFHAILSPDVKPEKPRSYRVFRRFPA